MRGPLPLDDHDFASIRAQVMARIERPRRAPLWRVAFASLVLAVLSIVVGRQPAVRPSPGAPRHPLPLTRERGEVARIAPLPRQRERVAEGRVRVTHHHKPPPQTVARIELQTADPNVRIIWITN